MTASETQIEPSEKSPSVNASGLAEIALPVPIYNTFTYSVPDSLRQEIVIGGRVIVPFGKTYRTGVVVGFPVDTERENIREIIDLADGDPPVIPEVMDLCRWIAEYYICPLGEVLAAAHPAGMMAESKKAVKLTGETDSELLTLEGYAETAGKILSRLKGGKRVPLKTLRKDYGRPGLMSILLGLERRGLVEIFEDLPRSALRPLTEKYLSLNPEIAADDLQTWLAERELKAPRQASVVRYLRNSPPVVRKTVLQETGVASSTLKSLIAKGIIREEAREIIRESREILPEETTTIVHTRLQRSAIKNIDSAFDEGGFTPFLLFGVTGSGKTEVYLEVISHCLEKGKSALVLVPEIALTPQISSRFRRRFGGQVVVLHSRISAGERYDSWRRLAKGAAKVAIGARSALFSPMKNLGMIIVDEEHEPTFKQENRPHYNARDCAMVMGKKLGIPVVLGSATPSVETFENARGGKYHLLELPERVAGGRFSTFNLVDLTKKENLIGDTSISRLLMDKIEDRLERGDKIIILQNRRGFSTFLKCLHCGTVEECHNCSVTLTYHITNRRLRCHLCGFQKKAPAVCFKCGSAELLYCGLGTQRVEDEIYSLFPDIRIARMDLDTTAGVDSHFHILRDFQSGKYDMLLGTQMVAKGLDFPDVTLVGIINADTELLRPDFRAEERTFRLLVQAAGRSGRHRPGEVVVQTYNPGHKVFDFVRDNNYIGFFEKTLHQRRILNYPPFGRLIGLRISSLTESLAAEAAAQLALKVRSDETLVLGPSPALLSRVKRRYFYNILIKIRGAALKNLNLIKSKITSAREEISKEFKAGSINIDIDVDPITLH